MRDFLVFVFLACITQQIVEAGLSCDGYGSQQGVTCTLSSWVCGQRGANWETRTLTLKYSNGRSSSRWESRSPCRGGGGGGGSSGGGGGGGGSPSSSCTDTVASSTCEYWKENYGCSHSYVKPRCCKTCQENKPEPKPEPEPEPSGGGASGDQGVCVNDANKYRRLHRDTPSLKSDSRLTSLAQAYANKLLNKMMGEIRSGRSPRLEHDSNNRRQRTGENLYYANTYEQGGLNEFCKQADKSWYDEIKDYSFSSHRSTGGVIGHFTQMVWKGSRGVGYGYAAQQHPRYPSNRVIVVVAKYSPPGNYVGQYAQNVMPRK